MKTHPRTLLKLILFSFFCHLPLANACDKYLGPAAIMGGQGNAPYAAFIETDGSVRTIQGLPLTGLTYRVDINSFGEGIIGGTSGLNAYAALVSPRGILTPIAGLIAPGEIYTVSINEAGNGLVGGGHQMSNVPYAALISPEGIATSILGLPANGLIYGVAIEKTGSGIIGGIGPLNSAYAALTSPTGTLTPLSGLPSTGAIFWVAVNDLGKKFIGGNDSTFAYAAFVAPNGSISPVAGLPAGQLYSVAINNSGTGLVGGKASNLPYAALVVPTGSLTTIAGLPVTTGIIYNVALNESGMGLLAGLAAANPFGAFVTPEGILKPLIGLPSGPGFLDGAAIHDSGVAIVGGVSGGAPFAAVVAPNGNMTFLSGLPNQGEINSIAIATLDNLVPRTIGPYDSWANTQFVLSNTLTQHCIYQYMNRLLCDCEQDCCKAADKYSLWIAPFGNYTRQKSRQAFPGYTNEIAGGLLGFDYDYNPEITLGGGLAYGRNYVNYFNRNGHTLLNHEAAVIYATLNKPCYYVNIALWGGLYQASHTRKSFTFISSRSKPKGWNLSPHVELGRAFYLDLKDKRQYVEPFVMFDWVNNWQSHIRERGESGFNLVLKNRYASILRSEIGLRFYESFHFCWGCLVVQEKASYVNRTVLTKGHSRASFIEAISSFDVETLCSAGQNHGVVEVHMEYLPTCLTSVYASLDYQGEFGTSFQSQTMSFSLGVNF